MTILSPSQAKAFVKAKYTKRWKGKDGKWHYEYAMPKKERAIAMATSEAVMDAIQETIAANPKGTFAPATFTARHGRAATQTAFKTALHHGVIEVAYQGDRGPVYKAGKRALNIERPKTMTSWEEREKAMIKEGRVKMDAPVKSKPRKFKIVDVTPKGYGPNG